MDISFKMGDEKFNYRVSAIIISNGRILAMYHDKPSEYYSLPGGRVMMGETAEQAMVREIQEELGVSLKISRPLFVQIMIISSSIFLYKRYRWSPIPRDMYLFFDGYRRCWPAGKAKHVHSNRGNRYAYI